MTENGNTDAVGDSPAYLATLRKIKTAALREFEDIAESIADGETPNPTDLGRVLSITGLTMNDLRRWVKYVLIRTDRLDDFWKLVNAGSDRGERAEVERQLIQMGETMGSLQWGESLLDEIRADRGSAWSEAET